MDSSSNELTRMQRVVNAAIRWVTKLVCRVDASELARVPRVGPLILVSNHINFLEVPVIYTRLLPRRMTGFVKAENWDNPLLSFIFDLWEGIPVRRGEVDRLALRQALAALREGKLFAIAPEGTRSGHGHLQTGHPGIVILALKSGAPLLPVVHYGGEQLYHNLRRLRRTDFHILVGEPFHLDTRGDRIDRRVRQQMVDEIMYQMASLLPARYRGVYADLSAATETYIRFHDHSMSNLKKADRGGAGRAVP